VPSRDMPRATSSFTNREDAGEEPDDHKITLDRDQRKARPPHEGKGGPQVVTF